jgi:transposase
MPLLSRRFVGIDLGKRTYELRLFDRSGSVTGWNGTTSPDGRKSLYARLLPADKVAVEVCALAFVIADEIAESVGCEVVILNASKLAIIYRTTKKTDKEDALKLARLIKIYQNEDLPIVHPPSNQEIYCRRLLAEHRQLKQDKTRCINRLHALFVHSGITSIAKKDLAGRKRRTTSVELLSGFLKESALRILDSLSLLDSQIKIIEDQIDTIASQDERIQSVQTIPGVGPLTATAFVSYVNVDNFSNLSQVASFLGLVPKIDCSSSINRYGSITKCGNSYLRSLLIQASWALVRSPSGGYLKDQYLYMTKTKGKLKKKAIVAIARKLSQFMFAILKSALPYQPRRFVSTASLADMALSG